MKHFITTTTLLSLTILQITFSYPAMCAKSKKEESKKVVCASKELTKATDVVSIENSKKNMSMEIAGDTAYYNGKAILVMKPLTNQKSNRNYLVYNLKNELIAYIEKGGYLNGFTQYNINFIESKKYVSGQLYESLGEVVEVIGSMTMDGKMNAANVIKFSTENNLRLKNNVAFQLPIIKLPTLKSNAVLTASK